MSRELDLYIGYKRLQEIAYQRYSRAYSLRDGRYTPNLVLSKTIVDVIVDVEWLEEFEECLPYVENCVNEFRSFIKNEDEIMLIQLSNKIDVSKTLDFITQHVDAIIDYDEEEESVTPGKLVNTVYENTYDIYENRFLYTLLLRCNDFLGDMYRDIERIANKNFVNISFDYSRETPTCEANNDMRLSLVYDKSKRQKRSKKVQLDKISRLSAVTEKLRELMDSELMRMLKKCKEVNDPLTMTNVLQKNPNFVKAVSLWNYLAMYDGKKIEIIEKDHNIPITPAMKENYYELSCIINMLCRAYLDPDFCKELNREYRRYQVLERKARKKELEDYARLAREQAIAALTDKYEKILRELAEKLELLNEKISHYRVALSASKSETVEHFMTSLDSMYEQRRELERRLMDKYSDELKDEKDFLHGLYEKQLEEVEGRIKLEQDNCALLIKQAKDAFRADMKEMEKKHQEEITKLNFIHDSEMQELEARYNEKISQIIDEKNAELEKQKAAYEKKILELREEHQAQITALREAHALEKEQLIHYYEEENLKLIQQYQRELADIKIFCEKHVEKLVSDHRARLFQVQRDHEKELHALQAEHEETCRHMEEAHERALSQMQTQCDETVEQTRAECRQQLEQMEAEHAFALKELQAEHAQSDAETRQEHQTLLARLEQEHLAQIKQTGEEHSRQIGQMTSEHEAQVMALRETARVQDERHRAERSSAEAQHKEALAQLQASSEAQIKQCQNEVRTNREMGMRERQADAAQYKAQIVQLNRNHIKEKIELEKEIRRLKNQLLKEQKKHQRELSRAVKVMTEKQERELAEAKVQGKT